VLYNPGPEEGGVPSHSNGNGLQGRVYAAVVLLSAAVLVLQIALNRIFSYVTWHHLAYISVSLALLGFGASGSVLAAFPRLAAGGLPRTLGLCGALAGAGTLLLLVVVGSIPLHPLRAAEDPWTLAVLALHFSVVTVPFFFAGFAIAVALREAGQRVNRLYFWDLLGAGAGCALAVLALDAFGAPRAVLAVGLVFVAAGLVASHGFDARARSAGLVVGALLLAAIGPPVGWLRFETSDDKLNADWVREGVPLFSRWTALFRTDVLGTPKGSAGLSGYRFYGISPSYEGPMPPFLMIVHDATAGALLYRTAQGRGAFGFFRQHVLTAPYVLRERPEVLVIGVGGGADILNALVNGASRVKGVELDPVTVDLITDAYAEWTGGLFTQRRVEVVAQEGRHFARSSDERFDVLQMTGVDTLSALSSGANILAENYLYTVEAFHDYLGMLRPQGLLSITGLDYHPSSGPTRHALRFASLAYAALRAKGAQRPGDHVIVVSEPRPIALFTMLTKNEPFSEAEIEAIETFFDENGLEIWYLPRRPQRQLPELHTILEGSPEQRDAFFEQTFLDLRPTRDDRPFFFSFYKWRHLLEHRAEIDPGHTLATGQLVLVLILGMASLFSVVAIALPLLRTRGRGRRIPARWGFLAYFAALGAGFIFAEICLVQRFVLFLGYPTYSLSILLFAFLSSAGVGAWLSGRLPPTPRLVLPVLTALLIGVVLAVVFVSPPLFEALLGAPMALRAAVTFALSAPLGLVLGAFFPYGIRLTSSLDPDFTPWAWAVNGCLTVVGSVVCIMAATTWGFDAVLAACLVIYVLGALAFVASWSRAGSAAGGASQS
jgi:hypothetical protein